MTTAQTTLPDAACGFIKQAEWDDCYQACVATLLGLQFAQLLGGAVVTETIFAWPGIGRLVVEAIFNRDFPVVQGVVLVVSLIFVAVNLLVDLAYAALDPRIRTETA